MEKPMPCPFCGRGVNDAFLNLRDDDDDQPIRIYTITHSCPVTSSEMWCEGDTPEQCHAKWNTRAPAIEERI